MACLLGLPQYVAAQASDNYTGAELIPIANQNYGLGTFQSSLVPLVNATVEPSEFFTDDLIRAGNINKSLWFKFTIASNRDVNIILSQKDSAILPTDVGLTVYENPKNWAGKHSLCHALPPITKFGSVGNTCLKSGEYYIQVCARARVVDGIQISLEVKLPNEPLSDPFNPVEVSFPGNSSNWYKHGVASCAYVLAPDFYPLQSLDSFNRAVNWRFSYPSYDAFLSIHVNFNSAQTGRPGLLVILKEDLSKPIKNWQVVDTMTSFYYFSKAYGCLADQVLDTGTYRAVLLYRDWDYSSGSIQHTLVRNKKLSNNSIPSQIEKSHKLGELKDGNIMDTFHCNSSLGNSCPNLKPDALAYVHLGDTAYYDLQDWYTFQVSTDKVASLRMAGSQVHFEMVLYKGDVTQTCQLSLVKKRREYGYNEYCLSPGTYSLRILRLKNSNINSQNYITYELVTKTVNLANTNFDYTDSLSPHVLPVVAARNVFTINSDLNYFSLKNQRVYTGEDTIRGEMIYREFHYVNASIPLEINSQWQSVLFKGRKSISNQTEFVSTWYGKKSFFCSSLDTGWYTLIQNFPVWGRQRECISTSDERGSAQIKNGKSCANSEMGGISNPDKLNNGQAIFASTKTINGQVYPDTRTISVTGRCIPCFSEAEKYRDFLSKTCNSWSDNEGLGIIEFELGQEMDLQLSKFSSTLYLIKGSVKGNSQKLYDTSAYVESCNAASYFCRLQPGKYSLVVFAVFPTVNFQVDLSFIPTGTAVNNEFEKAEDLGLVNGTRTSKPYLLNCLIFNDTTHRHTSVQYGNPATTEVEYAPDFRPMLFYTFHVVGNGRILIDPIDEVYLFRFEEGFDYQAAMNNPAKRDSIIQNSEFIRYSNSSLSTIRVDVNSCGRSDYLIVTRSMYWRDIPELRQLEITFTPSSTQPAVHDFCATAQALHISSVGSFSTKFDTRCTTKGEGFGEDGNNMACLPDEKEFGTFWAKVKIDPGFAYDVSFRLSALPGVSFANAVKYRILYGSCNGLNPGPCLSSLNTYIGFDCMKPGEYFFQIAVPKEFANPSQLTEYLKLDVDVISPKSGTCKPFEPVRPLASFNFKGNCEHDSVRFQNYSSQGSEIAYLWDFGDGQTATEKDPVHWYDFAGAYKDFPIKLWVSNTRFNLIDSFERFVRVWKEPLKMELNFVDSLIQCGAELWIEAQTKLPDAFFYYTLNTASDTVVDRQLTKRFTMPTQVTFVMFTAGCYIDSVVNIRVDQNLRRFPKDTLICGAADLYLDASPYTQVTWFPDMVQSPIYRVRKAGEYSVLTLDSGCQKRDTIHVKEYRNAFQPVVDTILCNQDSFEVTLPTYLKDITWFDQAGGFSRWISESGKYAVKATWDECVLFDTAQVRFSDIRNPIVAMVDSLCVETGVEIGTDQFASSYLWNTGETTAKIWVDQAGTYSLTLVAGACTNTDSIEVRKYPLTSPLLIDTSVCGQFMMHLDAGPGTNFMWWPTGQSSQRISVQDSGTYGFFKINTYGCEEYDTAHVLENCGPYFLMPSSFTPNGDGVNDWLVWAHPDVSEFRLIIFDRWGELLYETTNPAGYWDGMYKGTPLMAGTYYYQVMYGGFDWTGAYFKRNEKGFVHLLR